MALKDQVPVEHDFHRKSTGDEVLEGIDLQGKIAIVTGGYSGIGVETTRSLAKKGAKVIVPVRNMEKSAETLKEIQGDVQVEFMDLADLDSVKAFVFVITSAI